MTVKTNEKGDTREVCSRCQRVAKEEYILGDSTYCMCEDDKEERVSLFWCRGHAVEHFKPRSLCDCFCKCCHTYYG
jgi:hypothetical protein